MCLLKHQPVGGRLLPGPITGQSLQVSFKSCEKQHAYMIMWSDAFMNGLNKVMS